MNTKDFSVIFPYTHPPSFGHTQWPMYSFLPSSSLSIPSPLFFSARNWTQSLIPSNEVVPLVSYSFGVSVYMSMSVCMRARGGKKSFQNLNLLFLERIRDSKRVPAIKLICYLQINRFHKTTKASAKDNYTWIITQNIPSSCRCSGSCLVPFFPSHHLSVCCFLHSDHGLHCHHLLS